MSDKEKWRKYIDNVISHAIGSVEYGNYFYEQIKISADSAKDDCEAILSEYKRCGTKSRCDLVKALIDKRLEELEAEIADFISKELPKIIESENEWLDNDVAPFLDIKFDKVRSPLALLVAVPIAHIVSASTFPTNAVNKLGDIYDSILRQSLITGSPFDETEEDYIPRFNTFDRQLEAEAETLGSGLPEQYDRIVFTKNDNKIQKYMWSAILDTTTCLSCGMLDHKVFEKIEDVPMYPLHMSCRCVLICGTEEIFEQYPESYQKWFEKQSEKDKYKILGKSRYNLYKQGMKIKQFVNNNKVTPLVNLKLPKNLSVASYGARSEVINKLNTDDIIVKNSETKKYYNKIRADDNTDMITKIAENTGKDFSEIEKIVKHIFIQKHHFMDGRYERFGFDDNIVRAFERLKTKEFTDQDILLLNHEFLELTYMKNKKYNVYEVAHEMANKKYNWEETLR